MAEQKLQLEDWLDDLCVRFIINLPAEDLSSVARICFQVEEAQWFYEDFIRPLDPTLPSMSLRSFCLRIFQHCPLLASFPVENHLRAFEEFLTYKTRIPVRGAILLNEAMDSTVLVKGWRKGANWSFPRGKINKDEDDLDCAIREVYEETGYDLREAGLVPKEDEAKYIQIAMREQQIRLYIFRDVPMDTVFQPRTRKEISKIQWYKLSELPAFRKKGNQQQDDVAAASNANKFYMVAPFLVPLKKWVVQQKKKDGARASSQAHPAVPLLEETFTEDDVGNHTDGGRDPVLPELGAQTHETDVVLQQLLGVQPPTEVVQIPQANRVEDHGRALLQILHSYGQQHPQTASIPGVIGTDSAVTGSNQQRLETAPLASEQSMKLLSLFKGSPSPALDVTGANGKLSAAKAAPLVLQARQNTSNCQGGLGSRSMKLLSLFKGSPSPALDVTGATSKLSAPKAAPLVLQARQNTGDCQGGLGSRSGSKTPLSPADAFLLDYLKRSTSSAMSRP